MPHMVRIEEAGVSYACAPRESLLEGMHRLGLRGIPVGCRGGGCGVCKIEVLAGEFHTRAMSRDHVSDDDVAHQATQKLYDLSRGADARPWCLTLRSRRR